MTTRSESTALEMISGLKARQTIFWIVTSEEERVEDYLFEAAKAAKFNTRTWDVGQGVCEAGKVVREIGGQDPGETLTAIRERSQSSTADRCVWIMRDLPIWLAGPPGAPVLRSLRNLARSLPFVAVDRAQAIVILSPSADVPAELKGHAQVIDWPLPDREEIADILDTQVVDNLGEEALAKMNGERNAAIDAAIGLTGEEAKSCFNKSLVELKRIDPVLVAKAKKAVFARERVIELFDPVPGGLDAIGGLENVKSWLMSRTIAYSPEARAYGLPSPKGFFLVGVSGCGKSLTAKCVPTAWNCPLVRVDLGALKSMYVGKSEENLRKAFAVIAALGRCVVWFDEVEKSLQGATSGSADGGVSADALGAVLTWMQERQGEAFVIMTANDVTSLPPEFLRKGRFDEIFFVDLPNIEERAAVLAAALKANGRKAEIDLAALAEITEGFTGSELAAVIPDAMYAAFADGPREITTQDIATAISLVTPLSKTAEKKIKDLRDWAVGKARPATRNTQEAVEKMKRKVRVLG